MQVNFVDLQRQNKIYKKELMGAIEHIVDTASFILGDELEKFEKKFATFCNKKYCVGINSGNDALMLTLLAYGIGENDEVITTPNSYFSTAMTISIINAKPVFVDIDPKTYNIDVNKIEDKITKKTKAIIPVHLYGQSSDMDPIIKIANKYNLIIIEDACQAHGAKYKEKILPYTETGAFSFYPGKNLGAFGDGGAVVTNSEGVKDKLEYLRNDGAKKKYEHKLFGYKSRLDTIQAAILSTKLKYLNQFVEARRKAAKLYKKCLKGVQQIILPFEADYAYHSFHVFAIQCEKRDQLRNYLEENGISTVIHYPTPIHLQTPYRKIGFKPGDFPITESFSKKELSIPIFPEIKEEEIYYVCDKIKQFYNQ